ncbi:MAG: type II secretion system F family protein [Bdellovibrionaceae bacterium]|nr:type II secretion system F family protein [Pseudobdellovibrionaceae bacterium]MDW8189984.1 type II secretion system F family protein [Pseudobdellovibrionaceae bacterium]
MNPVQSFLSSPWFSYPAVFLSVFVAAYNLYPRLEEKFFKRAFQKRDEIKKLMDYMFTPIDDRTLDRVLLAANLGPPLILFFLVWPNFILGVVLMLGSWWFVSQVPYWYFNSLYQKRCRLFTNQMVDGLTIMANGIKAGLSVTQALERVVDNLPNPIAQEFNYVLSQNRLGRTLEEALTDLGERIPLPDVQMFVLSINILKETGGNLAETFSTIVTVIRERQKVEQKIQAMTMQGRTQGFIVSATPLFILMMFYFLDFGYVKPLFTSTLGLIILIMIFGLIIVGGLVIKKIVTIRV